MSILSIKSRFDSALTTYATKYENLTSPNKMIALAGIVCTVALVNFIVKGLYYQFIANRYTLKDSTVYKNSIGGYLALSALVLLRVALEFNTIGAVSGRLAISSTVLIGGLLSLTVNACNKL